MPTLYGEVEGTIQPTRSMRLNAHIGALTYLGQPADYMRRASEYDWRLSATRQIGDVEVHAALSGGGPGADYYAGAYRDRTALVLGASWTF